MKYDYLLVELDGENIPRVLSPGMHGLDYRPPEKVTLKQKAVIGQEISIEVFTPNIGPGGEYQTREYLVADVRPPGHKSGLVGRVLEEIGLRKQTPGILFIKPPSS